MSTETGDSRRFQYQFNLLVSICGVLLLAVFPAVTQILRTSVQQDFQIGGWILWRLFSALAAGVCVVLPVCAAARAALTKSSIAVMMAVALAALFLCLNYFDWGGFSIPLLRAYCAPPESSLFLAGYCGCLALYLRGRRTAP